MRPATFSVGLLAILVALPPCLTAQSTTSLRGTVTDKSGAAVPKANLTLRNAERGVERTAITGPIGDYEFPQIPPGTYQLTVEMTGFQKYQQSGIELLVNTPTTINVSLEVRIGERL